MSGVHHLALRQRYHDDLYSLICLACSIYRKEFDGWKTGMPLRVDDFLRNVFSETSGYPFLHLAKKGVQDLRKPSLLSLEAFTTFSTRLLATLNFSREAQDQVEKKLEDLDTFVREQFLAPELAWNSGIAALDALEDIAKKLGYESGLTEIHRDPIEFLTLAQSTMDESYRDNDYSAVRSIGSATVRGFHHWAAATESGMKRIALLDDLFSHGFGVSTLLAACDDTSVMDLREFARQPIFGFNPQPLERVVFWAMDSAFVGHGQGSPQVMAEREFYLLNDYRTALFGVRREMEPTYRNFDIRTLKASLNRLNFSMRELIRWRRLQKVTGLRTESSAKWVFQAWDRPVGYNEMARAHFDSREQFLNAIQLPELQTAQSPPDFIASLRVGLAMAHMIYEDYTSAADALVSAMNILSTSATHLAWADWYTAVASYMRERQHSVGEWLAIERAIQLHKRSKNFETCENLDGRKQDILEGSGFVRQSGLLGSDRELLDFLQKEPPSFNRRGSINRENR